MAQKARSQPVSSEGKCLPHTQQLKQDLACGQDKWENDTIPTIVPNVPECGMVLRRHRKDSGKLRSFSRPGGYLEAELGFSSRHLLQGQALNLERKFLALETKFKKNRSALRVQGVFRDLLLQNLPCPLILPSALLSSPGWNLGHR